MHEEEATPTMEPQEEPMDEDADAPYLDLEGDREMQAYNLIQNRKFIHTLAYNPRSRKWYYFPSIRNRTFCYMERSQLALRLS